MQPTTDSQPPDCRDEHDAMIPQAIYSVLQIQHDQLLTVCQYTLKMQRPHRGE